MTTKHVTRFGVDIRRERNDLLQTQTFNPRGRFYYEPGQTGDAGDTRRNFANSFASLLLYAPNNSGRDLPVTFPTRRELTYNFYFQDKWHLQNNGFPAPNAFTPTLVTMTSGFPTFTVVPIPSDGINTLRRTAHTSIPLGTSTWYNGLQVKLDRRVGDVLFLATAYTWSKGLNYADDDGGLCINMNPALNKARMSDNRTHVFTQSYMWQLPFGKGRKFANSGASMWILGGW